MYYTINLLYECKLNAYKCKELWKLNYQKYEDVKDEELHYSNTVIVYCIYRVCTWCMYEQNHAREGFELSHRVKDPFLFQIQAVEHEEERISQKSHEIKARRLESNNAETSDGLTINSTRRKLIC